MNQIFLLGFFNRAIINEINNFLINKVSIDILDEVSIIRNERFKYFNMTFTSFNYNKETNKEVLWEFRFRCIPNELNTLKQTIENNLRINETFKNLKIRK